MGSVSVFAVRVVEKGSLAASTKLRPATIVPGVPGFQERGLQQVFKHGAAGEIQTFSVSKGWFFKQDKGTNRVLKIPYDTRNKLERLFLNETLTPDQQRKYGCLLMTVAQMYNQDPIPNEITTMLRDTHSVSDLLNLFKSFLEIRYSARRAEENNSKSLF